MKEFVNKHRILIIVYSIWFMINFIALFVSTGIATYHFYPFADMPNSKYMFNGKWVPESDWVHCYDISEFAVYVGVPLFIIFIYSLSKPKTYIL